MELDTENKMMDFVRSLKYLVVFPDKKTQIYRSLRDISEDICVDYSTISKKLKNETGDIFISKGTDFIFWIQKIKMGEWARLSRSSESRK